LLGYKLVRHYFSAKLSSAPP